MKGRSSRINTHPFVVLPALTAAALLVTLVFGSSAIAGGGNSANAKACQKDGWKGLVRLDGTKFTNDGDCVSYGAHGGTLVQFTGCFVLDTDNTGNFSNSSLADVVAAAATGDSLTVNGTCSGQTTIDRNLTITGQASLGYSTPTLSGPAVHVLEVDSGTVTVLDSLTITGGHTIVDVGGGILNLGDLTLDDCTVTGNSSRNGGGISSDGTLTLDGSTSVTGNYNETPQSTPAIGGEGGGITIAGGALILNDNSSISDNASGAGGGLFFIGGTLTLNDSSSIHDNTVSTIDGRGGGIFTGASPLTMTLNGNSSVYDNTAAQGGGIYNYCNSSVVLNDDSTVTGNTAALASGGGGIFNAGTLTPGGGGSHVFDNYSPGFPTVNDVVDSLTCDEP